MAKVQLEIDEEFLHDLGRLVEIRHFSGESEAMRVAVREALHRATFQPMHMNLNTWVDLTRSAKSDPSKKDPAIAKW